ncbi:MAG: PolC-type DNA polymerase III [Clostridiales bacterium]|nr:PolC-type DNA polymerase III [Clostridiales bacterium]
MRRLAQMLGIPEDLIYGLKDLEVSKLDIYKDRSEIRIVLTGSEKIEENNNLLYVVREISKAAGMDRCAIVFSDAKDKCREDNELKGRLVRAVAPYMSSYVASAVGSSSEFAYTDELGYDVEEDKLIIKYNSVYEIFLRDSEMTKKKIASEAMTFIFRTFGINLKSYEYRPSEERLSDPMTDEPVYIEQNDDYYAMIAPQVPSELLRMCEEDTGDDQDNPGKKIEETGKVRIRKASSAKGSDEGVTTLQATSKEEAAPDKNSWEYKAREQQAENRKNGTDKGNKDFFRKNDESLIGRVKSGISTKDIEKVRMEDRCVNVRGRVKILEDGLKLSSSGKFVTARFHIIDKTGGIAAFAFFKPAEADKFEKLFGKGGYAGFQGEPTYDRGEFCIKVSGVFEADPPKGRTDTSEYKRVELHVHSKMSERDAVSDPDKIMKLAQSFGHRACAITDHGVVQAFPIVYNECKGMKIKGTEEPFKAILGCEGYLIDDGPTVFYNLPYDSRDMRHVGSFVTVAIKTTGNDSCKDLITHIAASKYRLKGYKGIAKQPEGESDREAGEFSAKDIDRSLFSEDEIPEELRDDKITITPFEVDYGYEHVINRDLDIEDVYSGDDVEVIPETIEYEHVADFYAEVEDKIYEGKGEPCDSYFKAGELLKFIGDSYISGPDVFNTLHFLRRAGYGINIEDHKYYRNKFLMPAISVEDIFRYVYTDLRGKTVDDAMDVLGLERSPESELMVRQCRDCASVIAHFIKEQGTADPSKINSGIGHLPLEEVVSSKNKPWHIIYLVRNNLGLYNLYRLVSEAHTHYFSMRPRTPRSLLKYFSSSIIIGGACERGQIYRKVIAKYKECGKDKEKTLGTLYASEDFRDLLSLYDYVEIQPLCNNMFMTREMPNPKNPAEKFVPVDADDIKTINIMLSEIADHYGMMLVATTDSHFLEKEDGMYRKLLLENMGFADADQQSDLYFRTTDEMLDEFSYLGEERAFEAVVKNTNLIADMIEYGIKPFPDGTYPPIIKRSPKDVRDIAFTRANQLYRHNGVLNEVVRARLEKELKSIIGNGFSVMYYIAYRLVKKSNNDGFIVGSRGSVGSSFVATMLGISEVNPLVPHYRCPKCCFVEFNNTGEYGSGFDMPPKTCPECGEEMVRDGQDIPFETFLGFFGDKQPDIDLNFSDLYQPRAHKYVEFLFGTSFTFRAGTIGAYQDKNAYGIVRKSGEKRGIEYTSAMLDYMSEGLIGVKNTTGQHPGGIVVVPKEMDIYEFTPVQFPANDAKKGIVTTHFDFRAMHDTILKLDILGHADPTVLRMLHEITGVEITDIPIPDDKVMSLFTSTDALGFPLSESEAGSATIGLPELGTSFARGMIKEAKPSHFYDLVQLMGLSHGTDVWLGNAQDLIKSGTCDIGSVIGCRDSIMTRLIYWGLPEKDSFDIMENVRKGKVAKGQCGKWEEWKAMMKENNVPDWYIESCQKIKYMFPKAHAAAYSISSLRVAWFKVYRPEEYYCAFFTVRGDEFSADTMCRGIDKVNERSREISELRKTETNASKKKKLTDEFYICELVEEMYHRGIEFLPIDINTSSGTKFIKVAPGKILPPLDTIDSISSGMAEAIEKARDEAPFANREDLMQRSGIGKSALDTLAAFGLLDDLPESSQIDMFSLLDGI